MKATLEETLRYRNPAVVSRFSETWQLGPDESQDIFDETLKWLWLGAKSRSKEGEGLPRLVVVPALRIIDEMWHTFLLFTRPYQAFCQRHFGFFLHHRPTTVDEHAQNAAARARDRQAFVTAYAARLREQVAAVCEQLGPATAGKWYGTYLDRYGEAFFQSAAAGDAPLGSEDRP
jgi:hypothetical protein